MGENKETRREAKAQTSPVWSYFKVCEDNAVMADCLLCGTRMSRGGSSPNRCGTTNLRRHILYTHNIHLPKAHSKRGLPDEPSAKVLRKKVPKKLQALKKKSNRKKSIINNTKRSGSVKNVRESARKEVVDIYNQQEPVMCIKWNTYVNNMTSTLPQLLQDQQFVDVTLACEGQSLSCHKILLAACSPYFYELLSSAACKHPIIMFKDYKFWELQALVAFMYCGEVNVPQSQLPRILRVAEALQIKGLAKPTTESEEREVESSSSDLEPCAVSDSQTPDSKRKRRPSTHNCCKNPARSLKAKYKQSSSNPRSKLKSPKKKAVSSPAKKPRLTPEKKCTTRKPPVDRANAQELKSEPSTFPLSNPLEQNCSNLPELLHNDMPDMLNDILAMRDTHGITEGISLPGAHKVGSVDGIFPLEDFEGMKMEIEAPFLSNGLNGSDHFDLLPQINPECRLDDNGEGR